MAGGVGATGKVELRCKNACRQVALVTPSVALRPWLDPVARACVQRHCATGWRQRGDGAGGEVTTPSVALRPWLDPAPARMCNAITAPVGTSGDGAGAR